MTAIEQFCERLRGYKAYRLVGHGDTCRCPRCLMGRDVVVAAEMLEEIAQAELNMNDFEAFYWKVREILKAGLNRMAEEAMGGK